MVKKVNFLIVGVFLTATVFGMNKGSSPIAIKKGFSVAVVGKDESSDFLARRASSGSSKDSPGVSPRHASLSRLSSSSESPQLERVKKQFNPVQQNTGALFCPSYTPADKGNQQ
jgi:hypothetical protein